MHQVPRARFASRARTDSWQSPFGHNDDMRVIGASWGRTGTTSAAAALELLGFGPCFQMQDVWPRPTLAALWNEHRAGRHVDWPVELREFESCVDWPGCWQWREFAELWPEAHVLLTVRDAESWYDSALGSIHDWTGPGRDVGPPEVAELLSAVWDEHFGGWEGFLDREHAIERTMLTSRTCVAPVLSAASSSGGSPMGGNPSAPPSTSPFPTRPCHI